MIQRMSTAEAGFDENLKRLLDWEGASGAEVQSAVDDIIGAVRARGDDSLVELTNRFDDRDVAGFQELIIEGQALAQALERIDPKTREALRQAAERIREYHSHQLQASWRYTESDGTVLGQKITPLDRVGMYVPGGKAAYPSSVLMTAIPAKVAGVKELVMVSPAPGGQVSDIVLAAAHIAGVDRVLSIGGAQAVAALAYGTESVPKVDKIVGPGNIYVATAKRTVFGQVAIDMIAGPSEILIVCDGGTDPDWIAMDLFSQAEHDENAQAILLTPDLEFLEAVAASMERLLPTLARATMAAKSLAARGALILTRDLDEALALVNLIAPEHLELSIADPEAALPEIRHAGAIFMGRHTSEAIGDYCAGPNHVLPTAGTARFSSPLGVYDFQKRSSLIYCSEQGASELGKVASTLARGERLEAHARAAEYRIKR